MRPGKNTTAWFLDNVSRETIFADLSAIRGERINMNINYSPYSICLKILLDSLVQQIKDNSYSVRRKVDTISEIETFINNMRENNSISNDVANYFLIKVYNASYFS